MALTLERCRPLCQDFEPFGRDIGHDAWTVGPSQADAAAQVVRSPLHAWISNPECHGRAVTAHGTAMAYVLPPSVAMGFGHSVARSIGFG